MFSSAVFWLSAAACLVAGLVMGWFAKYAFDPAEQKQRQLQLRLEQTELALNDYRTRVTQHFQGTAERVNRLTEDYRELHQHLSEGAMELCESPDSGHQPPLLTGLGAAPNRIDPAAPGSTVTPPLDYATPKTPKISGETSEEYDLDTLGH